MSAVVDASAMVELLIRSPGAAAVEAVLASDLAASPELLDVEVLHALRRIHRRDEMTSGQVERALAVLTDSPIVRVSHRGLISGAWHRVERLSAYDAVYVALAAALGWPLLTADRHLARAHLDVPVMVVPGSGG